MFSKRYPLWALVAVSFVAAAAAIALLAGLGEIKTGKAADQIYHSSPSGVDLQPAAWFEAKPASFADLAEKVQSAVVNVNTSKVVKRQEMMPFPRFGPRDPFEDFFDKFFEGVPKEQTQRSLGSGFIINKEGDILTNYHVVAQADDIEVKLADGRKFKAKVIGKDEKTDIALLKIKGAGDLPYVTLGDSGKLRPGDWVMAIGNPFGLEHTVTVGVVSALGRMIGGGPYAKFIQTDASINPGNSGGPLFNIQGEVVGINSMIYAAGQGIGFAIPVNLAKEMLPQLASKGSVTRGWLGVAIQDITPELAKSFNLKDEKGALIAEIYPDSPAAKAGVARGDIVTSFNGQAVEDPYSLSLAVGNTQPGSDAEMKVLRNGKEVTLKVKVGKQEGEKMAEEGGTGPEAAPSKADMLGLVVKPISPEDARELDLSAGFKGIVVGRVEPGSSAEGADLRSGDIILEINNKKVESLPDYQDAMKQVKKGDVVRLLVKRGHASIYVAFRA
jgi:serine protease Do